MAFFLRPQQDGMYLNDGWVTWLIDTLSFIALEMIQSKRWLLCPWFPLCPGMPYCSTLPSSVVIVINAMTN